MPGHRQKGKRIGNIMLGNNSRDGGFVTCKSSWKDGNSGKNKVDKEVE